MLLLVIITVSAGLYWIGVNLKLLTPSINDFKFLIFSNAIIHFAIMAEVYKDFGVDDDANYLLTFFLCCFGIIVGFWIENVVPRPNLDKILPRIDVEKNSALSSIALCIAIVGSLANLFSYYFSTGSINPIGGFIRYFTSGNIANEMWDTAGAEMYGADRGEATGSSSNAGGMVDQLLFYLTVRCQPVIYLALGLVKNRWRFSALCIFVASALIRMSSGYFARTSVLLTCGLLVLYFNKNIRRFNRYESIAVLTGGLSVFLVLHIGRMGEAASFSDLFGNESIERFHAAASATFEPIAFAMLYHKAIGTNTYEENLNHFLGYFGIFIPRIFWPTKPYYALEPDMTMALTGENISGNNPVRTFSIAGEGLLVGGEIGVILISIAFSFIAAAISRQLMQRKELEIVYFYCALLTAYAFRLSLFTFMVGNVVLTLLPQCLIYLLVVLAFGDRGREVKS